LAGQHRAHRAVDIADVALDPHRRPAVERRPGRRDERIVHRLFEMVFLTLAIMDRDARLWLHLVEDAAKIDALRLPVAKRAAHVELSDLPDHLAEIAEAEPCHQLADFLGDKE